MVSRKSSDITGFIRFGVATNVVNVVDWIGTGLPYHGLIAIDVAEIVVRVNHTGHSCRRDNRSERHEADFEATYREQVTALFCSTARLQYMEKSKYGY